VQPLSTSQAFYGTRKFITAFKTASQASEVNGIVDFAKILLSLISSLELQEVALYLGYTLTFADTVLTTS
jgi:hypothetical protein